MPSTITLMLRHASNAVGGDEELGRRLGIGDALLSACMAGRQELPYALLVRVIEIVLADLSPKDAPEVIIRRALAESSALKDEPSL